jgi:hypothetical protein
MKKLSILLAAVAALTISMGANAATGKITAVKTARDFPGWIFFKFTPATGGGTLPACATGVATNVQVFVGFNGQADENTHTKELILAAYTGAKTVDITGFNACDSAGNALLNTLTLK